MQCTGHCCITMDGSLLSRMKKPRISPHADILSFSHSLYESQISAPKTALLRWIPQVDDVLSYRGSAVCSMTTLHQKPRPQEGFKSEQAQRIMYVPD